MKRSLTAAVVAGMAGIAGLVGIGSDVRETYVIRSNWQGTRGLKELFWGGGYAFQVQGSPRSTPNRDTRSGAAAIKRASRKRRNIRARSSKRKVRA